MTEAPAQSFAALSAALTGFRVAELWGTGQVEPYLAEVLATVGDDHTVLLWNLDALNSLLDIADTGIRQLIEQQRAIVGHLLP